MEEFKTQKMVTLESSNALFVKAQLQESKLRKKRQLRFEKSDSSFFHMPESKNTAIRTSRRETKICVTLGRKTWNRESIKKMVDNGADYIRLNMAYIPFEEMEGIIKTIKEIDQER